MRLCGWRAMLLPALLAAALLGAGCGDDPGGPSENPAPSPSPSTPAGEPVLDAADVLPSGGEGADRIPGLIEAAAAAAEPAALTVDYPRPGSIFPPEFVPPTFLWHDPDARSTDWLVEIDFTAADAGRIAVLVPGEEPSFGEPDQKAWFPTNAPYEPTEYQRTAIAWTPAPELWAEIQRRSVEQPATVTFTGFAAGDSPSPLSRGAVVIVTSQDPVGAPIFYRDVPLAPSLGEDGVIKPLGDKGIPLIAWRLKDLSRTDSKVVLTGMNSCGNCHSFSRDGQVLGMDVDGPTGDKGMYALKTLSKNTVIGADDVLTWNSFTEKPKEHRTIGFLSRVSPDGQFVLSTVNETLFVQNFENYRYLQVFYPTRGILASYSRETDEIRALPGADDPDYVSCDPVWSPDGETIVFARAEAFDPYVPGQPPAEYPNDPSEPRMRYDLYRMPFAGGRGGTPEPVLGASGNGMSNTFPKVSPDGKWIVYVRCRNGQLMRPDGRLVIVPFEGGEAREMRCNMENMNSWHSFSPNGRWMVFSSKQNTPYTQAFLTHLDEEGNDSPAILIPNCTASNRAVNLPEFLNAPYDALDSISIPILDFRSYYLEAEKSHKAGRLEETVALLEKAVELAPDFSRGHLLMGYALRDLGRTEEAIRQFELAVGETMQQGHFVADLAFLYLETGQLEKAVPVFKRAIRLECTYPNSYFGLVKTLRLLGRNPEVLEILELGHRLLPDNTLMEASLALELATSPEESLRDGPRAVRLAEEAVKRSGEHEAVYLDALAAALAETNRFEEAVKTAERALEIARASEQDRVEEIETHLEAFRRSRPYRRP